MKAGNIFDKISMRITNRIIRLLYPKVNSSITLSDLVKKNSPDTGKIITYYDAKTAPIKNRAGFYNEDFFNQETGIISMRSGDLSVYESPAIFSVGLHNVLIGKTNGAMLLLNTGSFIRMPSFWLEHFDFPKPHKLFSVKKLEDGALFIPNIDNYFHWFQETLTRLFIVNKYLPQAPVYLAKELSSWKKECLALFGLSHLNYLVLDASYTLLKSNRTTYIAVSSCPEIIHKDLMTEMSAAATANLKKGEGPAFRRIYISRRKARHRRVVNESELESFLANTYGFKTVCFEDHSIYEQYKMVHDAEVIVAVHGPSLTNLVCAQKPVVIELLNNRHLVECYAMFAFATNSTYKAIACENVGHSSGMVNKREFYGYNDMKVDLAYLGSVLNSLIETRFSEAEAV